MLSQHMLKDAFAARRHHWRCLLVGFLAMTALTVNAAASAPLKTDDSCCQRIELRQYTLHPGQRDTLIDLFDREFVESQEALGIAVIGQFRDLDRPDRFVWMRGFANMAARGPELAAFYDGPVWQAHRNAANATMVDSDNVLLLEPAAPGRGFRTLPPRPGGRDNGTGLVVVTLYYTKPDKLEAFESLFHQTMRHHLEQAGARTVAEYVTSGEVNNFPRLPIRVGEHIFVWIARFQSAEAYDAFQTRLSTAPAWKNRIESAVRSHLTREPEVLRLAPTGRSRLQG